MTKKSERSAKLIMRKNWKRAMASYKEIKALGYNIKARILTCDDCEISLQHKDVNYDLSDCPMLPLPGCKRKPCCGCTTVSVYPK